MLHRSLAVAALSVLVGACGQVATGDSSYVTVSDAYNKYDALPKATDYCAKFGRVAEFNYLSNYRAHFDCLTEEGRVEAARRRGEQPVLF
jgi:hypothetical protein